MLASLHAVGTITPLPKYKNCWLAWTNPADVARVESRTYICTEKREDAVCTPAEGVAGILGNWISPTDYESSIMSRFPGRFLIFCRFMIFNFGKLRKILEKFN